MKRNYVHWLSKWYICFCTLCYISDLLPDSKKFGTSLEDKDFIQVLLLKITAVLLITVVHIFPIFRPQIVFIPIFGIAGIFFFIIVIIVIIFCIFIGITLTVDVVFTGIANINIPWTLLHPILGWWNRGLFHYQCGTWTYHDLQNWVVMILSVLKIHLNAVVIQENRDIHVDVESHPVIILIWRARNSTRHW